ncbi:uncharacterized protein SPAPADRAFT_147315 [Spathaspora passalidarum NRRL Y-27907]|uniref:Trafficking protein particle complex subunit 11 domain-containing protein n=1 Tax=Spathaspora passalidarum (strain NRRL Y-27907 / 11-Y1) TaxID=619300 RepID=G3AEE8_SPAPN|nr:uncharacterized protein SPAPADRAFT_147315 [Spathaspora passalidarum NRRL Y-27907]EGW35736.1 hypothetical protein SPAPADRAFT_147315 [Spathaspora passalidarum NRRL Y-27907]
MSQPRPPGPKSPIKIGYYDPFNIYPKIKDEFEKKLPLTSLHLKFQDSQSYKSIPSLPVSMFEEVPKKIETGAGELAFDNVYTRLMFIKIDSIENYRSSVRPLIREWLKNIVFKARSSWMIVLYVPSNVKDTKSVMKVSRFDKLKNDFGIDGKELPVILPGNFPDYDGERCLKYRESGINSKGIDSSQELVLEIKTLLLSSFTTRYGLFRDWIKDHKIHSIEGFISSFRIAELLNDMALYQESLDEIEHVREKLTSVVEYNPNMFDENVHLPKHFEEYTQFESSFADTGIRNRLFRKTDINLFRLHCLLFINYSSVLQALSSSESLSISSIHVSRLYQQLIVFLSNIAGKFPHVDLKEFQYSVIEYYLNIPSINQLIESSKPENEDSINTTLRNIYEFRAELKLFQRSIVVKIAAERGYSISGLKVLEDVPLEDTPAVSKPKKFINPKLTQYMADKSAFFAAFTSITEEIIRDFVECERSKSVDILSIDLAVLNYEKGNYEECLEILRGSYDFFIANGWNYLGGILLEIYNGCIEKLNRNYDEEILTTCLKLATCLVDSTNQTGINSYGLIKNKSQVNKLFSKINEYSLKQEAQIDCSLDELFRTRIYLSLHADASTSRDEYYIELEINNPFQREFHFRSVEAVMVSNEGHQMIFKSENVDIPDSSKHIMKLYSNTFIMGSFKPYKLSIALNEKLSLVSEYIKVHKDGTIFKDSEQSRPTLETKQWYHGSLHTFHDIDKFRCEITCPDKLQLGVSKVLLNIHNGDNEVKNVKIKMFSTTEGLKITQPTFNIDKLDARKTEGVVIPYSYLSQNKVINMKSRIIYEVEGSTYIHEVSYNIDTALTISVSVYDIFKQDFIYSKFQIGTSNPEYPIRVLRNQLTTTNENYIIATSKPNSRELVAFGEQPTCIFFRITPKENYMITSEDTVDLSIWYTNLQEECESHLFDGVVNKLREINLVRYWFMLKSLIFSQARFDLNKYALDDTIEVYNQNELNILAEKVLAEYVEEPADRKELLQLVQDRLTSTHSGTTTRKVIELNISVPIPIIKYLQIVEYEFERKSQYVVGEAIAVTLKVTTISKWSAEVPSKSLPSDEFQALVQNDDNWLVSGYKKHSFTNENSLQTELLLIPLNVGKILLPKVFVKFLNPEHNDSAEHASLEVDFKNGLETLLVVPEVNSVTFSF